MELLDGAQHLLRQSNTACFKTLTEEPITRELGGTNSSVKSIGDKFDRLSQQLHVLAKLVSADVTAKKA